MTVFLFCLTPLHRGLFEWLSCHQADALVCRGELVVFAGKERILFSPLESTSHGVLTAAVPSNGFQYRPEDSRCGSSGVSRQRLANGAWEPWRSRPSPSTIPTSLPSSFPARFHRRNRPPLVLEVLLCFSIRGPTHTHTHTCLLHVRVRWSAAAAISSISYGVCGQGCVIPIFLPGPSLLQIGHMQQCPCQRNWEKNLLLLQLKLDRDYSNPKCLDPREPKEQKGRSCASPFHRHEVAEVRCHLVGERDEPKLAISESLNDRNGIRTPKAARGATRKRNDRHQTHETTKTTVGVNAGHDGGYSFLSTSPLNLYDAAIHVQSLTVTTVGERCDPAGIVPMAFKTRTFLTQLKAA